MLPIRIVLVVCPIFYKNWPARKLAGVSGRQIFSFLYFCFSASLLFVSLFFIWLCQPLFDLTGLRKPDNSLFSDLNLGLKILLCFDSLTGLIHRSKCRVPQIQVHPDWRRWVCCGLYGATLCRVPSGQHSFYSSKTEADPWTEVWRNQIWVPETWPQQFWKNNRQEFQVNSVFLILSISGVYEIKIFQRESLTFSHGNLVQV